MFGKYHIKVFLSEAIPSLRYSFISSCTQNQSFAMKKADQCLRIRTETIYSGVLLKQLLLRALHEDDYLCLLFEFWFFGQNLSSASTINHLQENRGSTLLLYNCSTTAGSDNSINDPHQILLKHIPSPNDYSIYEH